MRLLCARHETRTIQSGVNTVSTIHFKQKIQWRKTHQQTKNERMSKQWGNNGTQFIPILHLFCHFSSLHSLTHSLARSFHMYIRREWFCGASTHTKCTCVCASNACTPPLCTMVSNANDLRNSIFTHFYLKSIKTKQKKTDKIIRLRNLRGNFGLQKLPLPSPPPESIGLWKFIRRNGPELQHTFEACM